MQKNDVKTFETGQLCYVVLRRHKGKGAVKLILHEARAEGKDSFFYGSMRHWVVSPATLLGMSKSSKKKSASIKNGSKGGRPTKKK